MCGQRGNEEEKNMTVSEQVLTDELKRKLDKISSKLPISSGKDNMIELDPNNPHHREWFEVDKYKGE